MIMTEIKNKITSVLKEPIFYILIFNFVLFIIGIEWGLPNTESWHADDLAPFHPLMGLSRGFSFGYLNKYPLVHQFILAILNIPVVIAALVNSNPLEGLQVLRFLTLIRSAEYATALIIIDRLVSVAMGLGIVYYMYLSARELFSQRVAVFTAIILSFNALVNYFAHVSKNEGPYIFWAVVALYKLIQVIKYERLKDYILLALFACFSYGSKDQGYAIFILPFILYTMVYQIQYRKEGDSWYGAFFRKKFLVFGVCFLLFTVITQNMILNWEGFIYRYELLTGWEGHRSISYTLDVPGLWALFYDTMKSTMIDGMGIPFFIISMAGIILLFVRFIKSRRELFEKSIFIIASVSFYLFFIQIVRQSSARYEMPQSIFFSIYGGFALDFVWERARGKLRYAFVALMILICGYSFYYTFSVNMNFVDDMRYTVEEWMDENIEKGSTIEYYSWLHYLPRMPQGTTSYRVKSNAMDIERRQPDYIILTSHYYPRFIGTKVVEVKEGRIQTTQKILKYRMSDFPEFFAKLFNNELKYRQLKRFNRPDVWYQRVTHAHMSPEHIIIYKRIDPKKLH